MSLDSDEIQNLGELLKLLRDTLTEAELTGLILEKDGFRLEMLREPAPTAGVPAFLPPPSYAPAAVSPAAAPAGAVAAVDEPGVQTIKSPMVGTFYRAPTPESAPYVEEGAKVKAETVVCIIEAMKVMNEIQAELAGTVIDVLVENGDPVEYGQPLFKVRQ